MIWIYNVCKCRVYPGSAGQGLTGSPFIKFFYSYADFIHMLEQFGYHVNRSFPKTFKGNMVKLYFHGNQAFESNLVVIFVWWSYVKFMLFCTSGHLICGHTKLGSNLKWIYASSIDPRLNVLHGFSLRGANCEPWASWLCTDSKGFNDSFYD